MAVRACLKCGEDFESTGSGNRICPRCARENRGVKQSGVKTTGRFAKPDHTRKIL